MNDDGSLHETFVWLANVGKLAGIRRRPEESVFETGRSCNLSRANDDFVVGGCDSKVVAPLYFADKLDDSALLDGNAVEELGAFVNNAINVCSDNPLPVASLRDCDVSITVSIEVKRFYRCGG